MEASNSALGAKQKNSQYRYQSGISSSPENLVYSSTCHTGAHPLTPLEGTENMRKKGGKNATV